MRYLLSVPQPLGSLDYMSIWHDNSGEGADASWYLDSIVVKDLHTDERYIVDMLLFVIRKSICKKFD